MPCYHPMQAYFSVREDGKKALRFSNTLARSFKYGVSMPDDSIQIPCGRCIGCRLERSRQWAVRCVHEAKLHEDNCFLTLTYDPEHLAKECPDGSLNRKHFQDFFKRFRKKYPDRKIRVFYCGEYGDMLSRPHFHACVFNFDFEDKRRFKRVNDEWYYVSEDLRVLWPFGFHAIGNVTFESAAYVARYCTKKVSGTKADEHYAGRVPEFCGMSLKPGIGRGWIDLYGKTDVFPEDEVVVRGVKCKPPRYYDKVLQGLDPVAFEKTRESRIERAEDRASDSTFDRLVVREKCQEARFKKLIRTLEK